MIRNTIKRLARSTAGILPLRLIPLEGMLRLSQRATSAVARAMYVRDWRLQAFGRPQFFKHQVNLSRWPFEPGRWSFAARGVYAREDMFRGCRVLDLCCGDGSFSYLFFSDIAGHIDAVDNDSGALAYARKYCHSPVISYTHLDILRDPLPSAAYDRIVWNAAICYFRAQEIDVILGKLVGVGAPAAVLTGMLPKANGWIDHKTEFADAASVYALLNRYFATVSVKEIDEGETVTFYFRATEPVAIGTKI